MARTDLHRGRFCGHRRDGAAAVPALCWQAGFCRGCRRGAADRCTAQSAGHWSRQWSFTSQAYGSPAHRMLSTPLPSHHLRRSLPGALSPCGRFSGAALLAALRQRLRLRPAIWRLSHTFLAAVTIVGSVVHALLIEGTMETVSKTILCALALGATREGLDRSARVGRSLTSQDARLNLNVSRGAAGLRAILEHSVRARAASVRLGSGLAHRRARHDSSVSARSGRSAARLAALLPLRVP